MRLVSLLVEQIKDRPLNPSDLRVVFLMFAHVRVKQHALTAFLLLHAHDVSCSHVVLYIFIFFLSIMLTRKSDFLLSL